MKARKHNFSSDLRTATVANHPDQGQESRGARTFSGRTTQGMPQLAGGPAMKMGGAPVRPNFNHKPQGKTAVSRPNGGSFKPGAGRGKLDPMGY